MEPEDKAARLVQWNARFDQMRAHVAANPDGGTFHVASAGPALGRVREKMREAGLAHGPCWPHFCDHMEWSADGYWVLQHQDWIICGMCLPAAMARLTPEQQRTCVSCGYVIPEGENFCGGMAMILIPDLPVNISTVLMLCETCTRAERRHSVADPMRPEDQL